LIENLKDCKSNQSFAGKMNPLTRTLLGAAILAASLYFAQAQDTNTPISEADLEAMLQALEQTPPTPASSLPDTGTFWSAQHAPGTSDEWPPLPVDALSLDAWSLGDGIYLLDDTNVDYDELAAQASTNAASASQ
jgi:hypothetical protein